MRIGSVQKKILLLLLGGLTIGLSGNPRQCFRVVKIIGWEWKKINREEKRHRANFQRSLKRLYDLKLISTKKNPDGTVDVVLTEKGTTKVKKYSGKKIKPKKLKNWDKKWRIIIFDIPEKERIKRDIFRAHLKEIDFFELQKSVWVSPVDYENEIDCLTKELNAHNHVNFIVTDFIKNKKRLEKHFKFRV
ncbi:hypothetical protein J7J13_04305 [bacterium]|nr:hypothetical protein [bacterium]